MRKLIVLIAAVGMLGGSGHLAALGAMDQQHVRQLLAGIFDDVTAILSSFAGGPDDPRSPVTDKKALANDSARLDSATQKANQLASELSKLQEGGSGGR